MTTLPNWLLQRAYISPDRLAVIAGSQRITFRELSVQVDSAARKLVTMGLRDGDRLALLLRNGYDFVILTHAASRLGVVLVPLNIRLTPAEIAWQLADVKANALIYDAANRETALSVTESQPSGSPSPFAERGLWGEASSLY